MNSEILELEKRIAQLKAKENKDKWEEWYKKGKNFIESIVGKCYATISSTGYLYIYKIKGFKEQGVWGSPNGKGYFILETEGHLSIHHTYSDKIRGHYSGVGDYGYFPIVNKKGSSKKIDYDEKSLGDSCMVNIQQIVYLGRWDFNDEGVKSDNFVRSPDKSIASEFFNMFTYEFPEEIYQEYVELYKKQILEVHQLNLKHQDKFEKLKRVKYD